jgi:asparagine synthase (glutamine-hydrolysing)
MSGFIFKAGDSAGSDKNMHSAAGREAFRRKGMPLAMTLHGKGYALDLFANASHDPALALSASEDGCFCTYVGTLVYRGVTGKDAMSLLLDEMRGGKLEALDAAIGNFCVLAETGAGFFVATDRGGLHHVYTDADLCVITNSFIAACAESPKRNFRSQELQEYIFLGATFGRHTLLDELNLLDSESAVRTLGAARQVVRRESVWAAGANPPVASTIDEHLSRTMERADDYYGQLAQAFGQKITAALSGGYDSRLNLALLLKHRVSPRLFVYGTPDDPDVTSAKRICEGEGLVLSHQDRGNRPKMEPDAYWSNQEDVFHGLDALTQYGFACEPFEVSHRRDRVAGGLVAVNGGGGEIWRDFWKVPGGSMRAFDFVRSYFSGRIGGGAVGFSEDRFLRAIGEKVDEIVGSRGRELSAPEVQSLYARLRLRFWQGKNNSVDNLLGYAVTPFSEHHFSVPAMWIPLRAKRTGWFESQLIQRAHANLASYPSSYAYTLERGPSLPEVLKSALTVSLPTRLRAWRRRRECRRRRFYFQTERYVRARFGSRKMEVERHVQLSQLCDGLAFSRALTVERMLRGEWL